MAKGISLLDRFSFKDCAWVFIANEKIGPKKTTQSKQWGLARDLERVYEWGGVVLTYVLMVDTSISSQPFVKGGRTGGVGLSLYCPITFLKEFHNICLSFFLFFLDVRAREGQILFFFILSLRKYMK